MKCVKCNQALRMHEGRWIDKYWEEWGKWQASYQEKVNYCAACPSLYTYPTNMKEMIRNEGEYDHEPDDPLSRLVVENETTS